MDCLPELNKVFFVHYQCEDFEQGNSIYSFQLYVDEQLKEFKGPDEATFIHRYCDKVNQLCESGLIPVHWSQNRPNYGPDHIVERYRELTGQEIEFSYPNAINLSNWLKKNIDVNYIDPVHPNRLDRLAELNHIKGHSQKDDVNSRVYPGMRLLLIVSIYTLITQQKLKTDIVTTEQDGIPTVPADSMAVKKVKTFADFLLHADRERLAQALKKEFSTDKGRMISLLIHALQEHTPPLLMVCKRENKALHEAMSQYFGRDIGAYKTIMDYDVKNKKNSHNLNLIRGKVQYIIDYLNNSNVVGE